MNSLPKSLAYVSGFFTFFFLCLTAFISMKDSIYGYLKDRNNVNRIARYISTECYEDFLHRLKLFENTNEEVDDSSVLSDVRNNESHPDNIVE